MPHLVDFIGDPNPEISNRIAALIRRPCDPVLRVEVAVRLLSVADPDWMEIAVYMLFEDPIADYDLFVERTRDATGLRRVIFEPVAERLKIWKSTTERFIIRQKRLRIEKPAAAAREAKSHKETKFYEAEAAYWSAVDALEEFHNEGSPVNPTASRPARG